MPKGFQNYAKMDAQIGVFACFFNTGENARNYCIYNRKRGSGHPKIEKSTSKMSAKSMFEKSMQQKYKKVNLMSMILKRDQNRGLNPMKIH